MSKKSASSISSRSPTEARDRFDLLANEKGWTEEMLQHCGDLPRVKLPRGVSYIAVDADRYKESTTKSRSSSNTDQEYEILHKKLYAKLRKCVGANMNAPADVSNFKQDPPNNSPTKQPTVQDIESSEEGAVDELFDFAQESGVMIDNLKCDLIETNSSA